MPTYNTETGLPAESVELALDCEVDRVVVTHDRVVMLGAGRECIVVERPTHPGAGLSVEFGEHVSTQRLEV